jgi:membrane-bound lytic murein transglycosylase B
MGHTQFIPTSFLAYAVDFTGDGRRDLWAEDALDALASTAHYLARFGWDRNRRAFDEVRLPEGFAYGLADGRARPAAEWRRLGVTPVGGGALSDDGAAELILPAGAQGPAFLTWPNFRTIKRYNNATSYALAVGLLADEIAGRGGVRGAWPRSDRPLSRSETEEMQRLLTRLGHDTQGVDGVIGPATQGAIRAFQRSRGDAPDGYASAALLDHLRRAAGG